MHRLLHFMSPSGHFIKHAASPRRSPSEIVGSCAFASVIVVAAAIQSTNKARDGALASTVIGAVFILDLKLRKVKTS
jgi:hypothetical protein